MTEFEFHTDNLSSNDLNALNDISRRVSKFEGRTDDFLLDPSCGISIDVASKDAVVLAGILKFPVVINFNGVEIRALGDSEPDEMVTHYHAELDRKHQEYVNSPEGKAAEKKRADEIVMKQARLDELQSVLSAVVNDRDKLVDWLGEVAGLNDDRGVTIYTGRIVATLTEAGYRRGDCVGDEEAMKDKAKFARWLTGQAIDGLMGSVGAIHPVCSKFADDYRAMT